MSEFQRAYLTRRETAAARRMPLPDRVAAAVTAVNRLLANPPTGRSTASGPGPFPGGVCLLYRDRGSGGLLLQVDVRGEDDDFVVAVIAALPPWPVAAAGRARGHVVFTVTDDIRGTEPGA